MKNQKNVKGFIVQLPFDYKKAVLTQARTSEGAYIENENDNFFHQEYREIYILLKQKLDLYHSIGRKLQ